MARHLASDEEPFRYAFYGRVADSLGMIVFWSIRSGSDVLLRGLVVVVADHSRDLPCSILILPEVDELSFSDSHLLVAWVMKSVDTSLEHPIALHVINL